MFKFIVGENLPFHFGLWHSNEFIHLFDLPEIKSDEEIWEYARKNNLIIITKDTDFSNKIMYSSPPPKVIHIKTGNLKIKALHNFLNKNWPFIIEETKEHKLVNVYLDRIESFE